MQKIEKLKTPSITLLGRVLVGGSQPRFYYVRFIGKSPHSPEFPSHLYNMSRMIENEFICYNLANIVGVNVPAFFVDKFKGKWFFFSRDRKDEFHKLTDEELYGFNSMEVALANAFNVWVINTEVVGSGRGNMMSIDGRLYLIDFTTTLLDHSQKWWLRMETAEKNKDFSRNIIWKWSDIDGPEFKYACNKIKSIPNSIIDIALRKAFNLGLIDLAQYIRIKKFLIKRKREILGLAR